MSMKKSLLAMAAVAALAFAALPAIASADSIDHESNNFTLSGGNTALRTAKNEVSCTSVNGSGAFEAGSNTTGTLEFTFHGCKAFGGLVNCQSAEQPTGTITTTSLPFHIRRVTTASGHSAAVLITPNAGHFATFKCGGLATIVVGGNGVIGQITSPGYNVPAASLTVNFGESGGQQEFRTVVGEETEYGLTASSNGGTPEAARQVGSGTVTPEKGQVEVTEA